MPILTNSNEPDLSDVGSFTAVPAIIRQLGPVEEPPAKGLHYRMGRQLRTGEAPLRQQSGPPRQVIINVGGLRFSMPWTTLDEGCPSERLGRLRSCNSHDDLMALCDDYDVACNEFFFDRHPAAFGAIAACLRAGKLRVSRGTCALAFREELAYWGVDEARLEWCCRRRLYQKQEEEAEAVKQLEEMETEEGQQGADKCDEMDDSGGGGVPARTRAARRLSWLMSRLRDMVEDPSSGLPGKIFAFLSVVFVAITAVSLCISTMPDLRAEEDKGECSQKCHDIFVVETVCVGWFSFEFLLRLIQSRSKWRFLRDPLNIIDVAAILPYYVTLVVDSVSDGRPPSMGSTNIYLEKVGLVLRVLRALRILYVMRLARHSLGLQTLGLTIRRCTRELGLLLLFLCVAMALFAPMVYLAENELVMGSGGGGGGASRASEAPPSEDSGIGGGGGGGGSRAHEFTSIPACYWWAIISMTTVGYGDMVPRSVAGQVVALSSILSGILLMAFPVTSIFHTFSRSYVELKEGQLRNLHLKHRVALLKAQATSPSLDSSQYSEPLGQRGGLIPSG
ncbi:voltage-gated potassium channel regulatory subunit KCNG2-like isoform X1 [Petromyzon marinus]|uniref:voltage-gated potassium channel regulatory subunit KCNG2-like isoform X1 n=1 Tax=Petromyzon marinus TaxID=7757 RepID=UPI003F71070A